MRKYGLYFAYLFAVYALITGTVRHASAETGVAKAVVEKAEKVIGKIQKACEPDIKDFCSKVTPGEGRLLLCMAAHEDKISDTCFTALLDAGDAIDLTVASVKRAALVCANEVKSLCADVDAGEGRIAQCLVDNKAKLSQPCRAEVAGVEARIKN
jgi:Golgi apparatus protein 1